MGQSWDSERDSRPYDVRSCHPGGGVRPGQGRYQPTSATRPHGVRIPLAAPYLRSSGRYEWDSCRNGVHRAAPSVLVRPDRNPFSPLDVRELLGGPAARLRAAGTSTTPVIRATPARSGGDSLRSSRSRGGLPSLLGRARRRAPGSLASGLADPVLGDRQGVERRHACRRKYADRRSQRHQLVPA